MRRPRILLTCLALAGLVSATAPTASAHHFGMEVGERDTPAGVAEPGPLGRSYAEWAADWFVWFLLHQDSLPDGCESGDLGPVQFIQPHLPSRSSLDCTVSADDHVFLAISFGNCVGHDVGLLDSQQKAWRSGDEKRARKLGRQLKAGRAELRECVEQRHSTVRDPYLAIDGQEIPIDDAFWTDGAPFAPDVFLWQAPGYYVMLEPLEPGSHTLEFGVSRRTGGRWTPERKTITLDVVAGTAPPAASCLVRNVTSGETDVSFVALAEAASDGDTLEVEGTCVGGARIKADLTIRGLGEEPTLDGDASLQVLRIAQAADVTLQDLSVTRGLTEEGGGGILNEGELHMSGGAVYGNYAETEGGGILNEGSLVLSGVELRDNHANGYGGGLMSYGDAVIDGSTLSSNLAISGGAIQNAGTLSIAGSILQENEAQGNGLGGAIYNFGELTITDSTITANHVDGQAGGIYNTDPGTVTIDEASKIADNAPDDCSGTPAC